MELKEDINVVEETNRVTKKKKKSKLLFSILIIIAIVTLPILANFSANFYVKDKISDALSDIKGDCVISHEKSNVNLFANTFDIYGLVIACQDEIVATVDNIHFNSIAFNYPIVEKLSATVTGAKIFNTANFYGKYGELLTRLSYINILFNADVATTYDDITKVFRVANTKLFIEDFGDIVIDFIVPGVSDGRFVQILKEIDSKYYSDMWVSFLDNGLTQRIIFDYAKSMNLTEEVAKKRILNGIYRRINIKYKDNIDMREKLVALSRFIEKPNALVFSYDNKRQATVNDVIPKLLANNWKANIAMLENYPLIISY